MLANALRAAGRLRFIIPQPGKIQRSPVAHSRELERILAIPIHMGYSNAERTEIENILRRPRGNMVLRPAQADALLGALEGIQDDCAIFAPLSVGSGKTLLAALLPTVLAAKRPLILTTASLEPQMRKLIREYTRHWDIMHIKIMSYSLLSSAKQVEFLDKYKPDLIIADEAHCLRQHKSARTRRVMRYLRASHRSCLFAALSGTMTKDSIRNHAHLLRAALRDWAPIPRDHPTLIEWSEALDPDPVREPGALMYLPHPNKDATALERYAYRRERTRGVASSPTNTLGATLIVHVLKSPKSVAIDAAESALEKTWCRPDGEELITAMEKALVDHQLRLGGCYLWAEEPNRHWLSLRRVYRRSVREWMAANTLNPRADTPYLVQEGIVCGGIKDRNIVDAYAGWLAIKDTAKEPPKHWQWLDTCVADWIVEHIMRSQPTCIFSDTVAVGQYTAEKAGAPYYGEGKNAAVDILKEDGTRSIVCSRQAHGQGRNLQCFSRAFVLGASPAGDTWTQLLGRLHREGQTADEVIYDVPNIFSPELYRAIASSKHLELIGEGPQKLNIATIVE